MGCKQSKLRTRATPSHPPPVPTALPNKLSAPPICIQKESPEICKADFSTDRRELIPDSGIFLLTSPLDPLKPNAGSRVEVQNTTFLRVSIILDFSSSIGVRIKGQEGVTVSGIAEASGTIEPESTMRFVEALPPAGVGKWEVTSTAKYSYMEPDEAYKSKLRHRLEHIPDSDEITMQTMLHKYLQDGEILQGDIVKCCKETGTPFIDTVFRAGMRSLAQSFERYPSQTILWFRPRNFLREKKPIILVQDGVSSTDIVHGALGDHWFLCGLTLLAHTPGLVQKLFPVDQQDAEIGVYRLRCCLNAWFIDVIVDDYFPCDLHVRPIYGSTTSGQLWVALAEKAYAKLHGSYQSIVHGSVSHALSDLTGYPCRKVYFPNDRTQEDVEEPATEEVWLDLLHSLMQGYIVGVGTPTPTEPGMSECDSEKEIPRAPERFSEIGPRVGYTYSVLRCIESSHGERIVNVGNSHSNLGSQLAWIPEMGESAIHDGTYWMSFRELVSTFTSLTICYYSPSFHNARIRGHFQDGESNRFLSLRIVKTTRVYITLSQKDVRGVNPSDSNAEFTDIGFFLMKNTGGVPNHYSCIHFTGYDHSRDVFLDTTLEADEASPYLIVPIVSFRRSVPFVISLHYEHSGCGTATIFRGSPAVVRACSMIATRQMGDEYIVCNDGEDRPLLSLRILRTFRWLGVLVQNNCTKHRAIIEQLDFRKSQGYKVCQTECAMMQGLCFSGLEIPPQSLRWLTTMCAVGDRWGYDYSLQSRLRRQKQDAPVVYPGEETGLDVYIDETVFAKIPTVIQLNKKDITDSEFQLK